MMEDEWVRKARRAGALEPVSRLPIARAGRSPERRFCRALSGTSRRLDCI